jgi:hypothetical protein
MRFLGIVLLAMVGCAAPQPLPTAATAPALEAMPVQEEAPQALQLPEEPSEPLADVVAPSAPPSRTPAAAKPAAQPAKAAERIAVVPAAARAPAARVTEPALDVAALKARLRETKAFGMFTKIALENQMDDLVKQFRALHEGGKGTSVATLRAPFDALVAKVVGLLQEGDASLARVIAGSREAIWDILSDPDKFDAAT